MDGEPPVAKAPVMKAEMSFLDHLEELRWRIIKGLGGILFGVAVSAFFTGFLIDTVLLGPAKADFFIYRWMGVDAVDLVFQSRTLSGQFFTYWGVLFATGFIIGAPIFFYQLWKFIEPALEIRERRNAWGISGFMSGMFLLGVTFGYLVLTPAALQFFAQFQISDLVKNEFDVNTYFTSVAMWVIACGIIFEIPFVTYALSKLGLLTPDLMRRYRRLAILICFVVGAILTPPDPISQTLVALPLVLLYEISIWISAVIHRNRQRALA